MHDPEPPPPDVWLADTPTRGLCALAAIGSGSLVCAALAGLFDSAGSQPWLSDTPEHQRLLAHCDQHRANPARQACVQRAIAALSRDRLQPRLARNEPDIRSLQDGKP